MMFDGQAPDQARNNQYGDVGADSSHLLRDARYPNQRGPRVHRIDDHNAAPVAIVSESVARRYWPGQHPIGKRLQFTAQSPWATVVGVAADTRYRELTRDWLTVYFQRSSSSFSRRVRSSFVRPAMPVRI